MNSEWQEKIFFVPPWHFVLHPRILRPHLHQHQPHQQHPEDHHHQQQRQLQWWWPLHPRVRWCMCKATPWSRSTEKFLLPPPRPWFFTLADPRRFWCPTTATATASCSSDASSSPSTPGMRWPRWMRWIRRQELSMKTWKRMRSMSTLRWRHVSQIATLKVSKC